MAILILFFGALFLLAKPSFAILDTAEIEVIVSVAPHVEIVGGEEELMLEVEEPIDEGWVEVPSDEPGEETRSFLRITHSEMERSERPFFDFYANIDINVTVGSEGNDLPSDYFTYVLDDMPGGPGSYFMEPGEERDFSWTAKETGRLNVRLAYSYTAERGWSQLLAGEYSDTVFITVTRAES